MNRESNFSLTMMIIIMALLAVFIGYLLGNWLIQVVTGDTGTQQVVQQEIIEEEIITDNPATDESNQVQESSSIKRDNQPTPLPEEDTEDVQEQISGQVFAVQVGAFANYNNAVALKNELEAKGFQVVVTNNSPHKVQIEATTNRDTAEEIEKDVEALGYNAFIAH